MRKQKSKTLWLGKILLVLLMIFSQMFAPIEVLAEELNNNETSTINEKVENNAELKEDVVNDTINTSADTVEENKQEDTKKIELKEQITPSTTKETNPTTEETNSSTSEENNTTKPEENVSKEESTPEDTIETKNYTYRIIINDEETEEYTISSESKTITIKQLYDGEVGTYHFSNPNETETIDFTNKLYGNYKREYKVLSSTDEELETKNVVIKYEGDNNEILEKYVVGTTYTYVYENKIGVDGTNKYLTVGDVLEKFNLTSLKEEYNADLVAKDENGNTLSNDDEVTDKVKFILTNGEVEEEFEIDIYGDYNNDKILNIEDAKKIIDIILESKEDDEQGHSIESILDAGNSVYRTGIWDNFIESKDELMNMIENRTEVYRGEEFEVKYYITGFDKDAINGIEGKLNYNKEILELVGIEIDKIYGDINENGLFAYIFDDFNKEEVLMTIKFKAKEVGEANISIENILASVNGVSANLDDTIMTSVNVIEAGKGGDVEEETPVSTATQTTNTTKPEPVVKESSSYIRPIAYSSDSKIKYLEIKGYKIDFDPNKYEYSIKVKNSVKSLDLTVVLNDSNASYEVFGNENFKVGENTVKIVVTAEDGSTSTYTINVTREEAKEVKEEETKEKKNSKTIIIILIILVIIGLIYVIFKDDEEEK